MSNQQTAHSKGIFHGLPIFPSSIKVSQQSQPVPMVYLETTRCESSQKSRSGGKRFTAYLGAYLLFWKDYTIGRIHLGDKLQDMDMDQIFGFTDGSLMGASLDLTMNKARKMGWHGFVDSNDALIKVLGDFAKLKLLPPLLQ
ncbi:uncharacterized protein M421DRAFT_95799 [Didymella exigua CBS 183.55]|uniref:Uncharacterized protein n=1 Tax=Didymella exigua CBS 183.55 TaxID=1150837 RepID=A0A6A5R9B7_9PLEO|nr:uncharacterized protein M421DRAFT_95799 [Didymella exigua CBS 183.55]KAF1923840.1 hypothetical protein M421DRAFT_95799 [Didymella exigua CBS 183.55]